MQSVERRIRICFEAPEDAHLPLDKQTFSILNMQFLYYSDDFPSKT